MNLSRGYKRYTRQTISCRHLPIVVRQKIHIEAIRLAVLIEITEDVSNCLHGIDSLRDRPSFGSSEVILIDDSELRQVLLRDLRGEEGEQAVDIVLFRAQTGSAVRRDVVRCKDCAPQGSAWGGGGRAAWGGPRQTRRC